MESSKGNTVGIVKKIPFSTYIQLVINTLQFFFRSTVFPQKKGKGGINHPLLFELPHLRIKPKTQGQQGKK